MAVAAHCLEFGQRLVLQGVGVESIHLVKFKLRFVLTHLLYVSYFQEPYLFAFNVIKNKTESKCEIKIRGINSSYSSLPSFLCYIFSKVTHWASNHLQEENPGLHLGAVQ